MEVNFHQELSTTSCTDIHTQTAEQTHSPAHMDTMDDGVRNALD